MGAATSHSAQPTEQQCPQRDDGAAEEDGCLRQLVGESGGGLRAEDEVHPLRPGGKRQPRTGVEAPPAQLMQMHRKTLAVDSALVRGAADGEADATTPSLETLAEKKKCVRLSRFLGWTSRLDLWAGYVV